MGLFDRIKSSSAASFAKATKDKKASEDKKKKVTKDAKLGATKKVVAKQENKEKKPVSMKDLYDSGADQIVKDKKNVADKKTEVPEQKVSMKDLYEGGTTQTVGSTSSKEKHIRKFANAYKVLIKPVVTERAAHLVAVNKYVFTVAPKANKIEIAKAVSEVYGIKPIKVNIISMSGKKVKYGKTRGQKKDWKKAVVTLPAGKTINLYEGV